MDLAGLQEGKKKSEAGVPVPIYIPGASEPTDMVFYVASIDSARVMRVDHALTNEALRKQVVGKPMNITAEDTAEKSLAMSVASVVGWDNVEQDGKPLECTAENVRMVLSDYAFIRSQVDEAAKSEALFFGK